MVTKPWPRDFGYWGKNRPLMEAKNIKKTLAPNKKQFRKKKIGGLEVSFL